MNKWILFLVFLFFPCSVYAETSVNETPNEESKTEKLEEIKPITRESFKNFYIAPRLSLAYQVNDIAAIDASSDSYYGESKTDFSDRLFNGSIAFGYDFFEKYQRPLRLEFEIGIFSEAKGTYKDSDYDYVYINGSYQRVDYDIEITSKNSIRTYFLNFYYDFHNFSEKYIPYVNAGIGLAFHSFSTDITLTTQGFSITRAFVPSMSSSSLACNFGAGFAYKYSDNILFDFGYRLSLLGKAKSGTSDDFLYINDSYMGSIYTIIMNQFMVGARYVF